MESLIGSKTRIEGDVIFSGGLHVDGSVIGSISAEDESDACLTISDKGRVEGVLRAPVVVLNGTLEGDVHASETLELGTSAVVNGNVHYKLLQMAGGAAVNGKMMHSESPVGRLTGPDSPPTPNQEADPTKTDEE